MVCEADLAPFHWPPGPPCGVSSQHHAEANLESQLNEDVHTGERHLTESRCVNAVLVKAKY